MEPNHHRHGHFAIHVLGILGNIASVTFFLASLPVMMTMMRTKSAVEPEVVSAVNGQLVRMMNCCMWVVYACIRGQLALWILVTNSLGAALSLAFLIPFCYFSPCPQRRHALQKLMLTFCTLGTMVAIMLSLLESHNGRIKAMGIMSGISSSLVHLGLLSQVREALLLKDQKYLKPLASLLAFIKGGTWVAYGLLSTDIYVMVPNGVGVLTGCLQVILGFILTYMRKKCTKVDDNNSIKVEVFVEEEASKRNVTIEIKIPQQELCITSHDVQTLEKISPSNVSITMASPRTLGSR